MSSRQSVIDPIVLLAAVVASAVGVTIAVSPTFGLALFGAISAIVISMVAPTAVVLAVAFAYIFFVAGSLTYFAGLNRAFWLSYGFGAMMVLRALFEQRDAESRYAIGKLEFFAAAFAVGVLATTIEAMAERPLPSLFGLRDFLCPLGLLLLALRGAIRPETLRRLWLMLLVLPILQLPAVIYQRMFVYGSGRGTFDAVVGLFGGDPEGGGASGAMVYAGVVSSVYAIALARGASGWTRWLCVSVCAAVLLAVVLGEVKFFPVYVLAAALSVVAFSALRRPLTVLAATLAVSILMVAVPYAYWQQYGVEGAREQRSFNGFVETMIERNVAEQDVNVRTGEIGRVTALRLWWAQQNVSADPVSIVLGNGAGSTRKGIYPGEIGERYQFKVARSALAVLLWEVGILGTGLFVIGLVYGLAASRREAAKHSAASLLGAALHASAACFALAIVSLPYNTDVVGTPQIQFLLALSAATFVVARARRVADAGAAKKAD